MDIAVDLHIPKPAPEPAPEPRPARRDPLAIPRWGTEGRYTQKHCPPPAPRTPRAAVPGDTILPARRSRLSLDALPLRRTSSAPRVIQLP